jgi:hypothetical protein
MFLWGDHQPDHTIFFNSKSKRSNICQKWWDRPRVVRGEMQLIFCRLFLIFRFRGSN